MSNTIYFLKKILSFTLASAIVVTSLAGCGKTNTSENSDKNHSSKADSSEIDTSEIAESITEEIAEEPSNYIVDTDEADKEDNNTILAEISDQDNYTLNDFIHDELMDEYAVAYDTFDAAITLSDGTTINGVGYCDFSSCFESKDEDKYYFPAGFVGDGNDFEIPEDEKEKGLEIKNLSYEDDRYGFVLAYNTESYWEHCVIDGKYVKYGIDDNENIVYTATDFSRDICDTSLGALYSYDENKFLYDPDVGEYVPISGVSLFKNIDYDDLEAKINEILSNQDSNFALVDVESSAYFAQDAVRSYLLSLQSETFLGCSVDELVEEVSKLDPTQCIRITSDGNVIVDIDEKIPKEASALAKWTVGVSCGIAIAGSIALGVFVPGSNIVSGAVTGAAIDVFMQVVIENNAIENINWSKVAISATSGALMAWACPLGAASIAESVGKSTGSQALSKLAGYGFLTFSNSIVSGTTNAAFTAIDKGSEKDVFDSFLVGAAVGACCTVAASALGEAAQAGMKVLTKSHPENWFVKLSNNASTFINNHQVNLIKEPARSVLAPKSVYQAAQSGVYQYNQQATMATGPAGGAYNDVKKNSVGKYTEVHETPSYSSTGASGSREQANGPSIKMTKEDHALTASYGSSREAQQYRAAQKALIDNGNYQDAIQMDIDDIHLKFGDKYDEGIKEMIEYAKTLGWWH